MKRLAFASCLFALIGGTAIAQEVSPFSFNIGAGFTEPVGNTGRHLDMGWNLEAGGGFNFGPYLSAMLDLGYNHMGINSGTLDAIGVPGGLVTVFSATVDPVIHLTPHGRFDIYITGGGGLYHRYQEFTQPALASTVGFDPFFGFFPAVVGVNQVLASYSVNKPGYDFGAGIALGSKWHGKFYAEARYNHMFNNHGAHTDYLPVSFGFRW